MNIRQKLLILFVVSAVSALLCACGKPTRMEENAKKYTEELSRTINAPIVDVREAPYMGATPVDYSRDYEKYPIFSANISLNMRGTLQEACQTVGQMLQLSMQVEMDANQSAAIPGVPAPAPGTSTVQTVNFEGKALALLDYMSTLYGVAWTYDNATRTVVFSQIQVRNFAILAAPGSLKHTTEMSSSSQQGLSNNYGNNSGNSSSTNNNSNNNNNNGNNDSAGSDTSQSLSGEYKVDVWDEVEKGVKALLSPQGAVTLNRAAGSIMVRDTVPVMRQVSAYIEDLNSNLLKQVALSVKVWSIEIGDKSDVALNLSLLFNGNFKLASAASSIVTQLANDSLTATIVDGNLKDSNATLKALNSVGRASQVTSGSGVCMNNQPLPVQNVKRQSYLASVSSFTPSTGGNTSALQPSQITYGFAMTVIPNILDRRRAVLQYNVSLSNLDRLEELKSGQNSIQLPTVSIRSFNQRAFMRMGQTLVLAGFEQERDSGDTKAGLFGIGHTRDYGKTLMVITITMESMNS